MTQETKHTPTPWQVSDKPRHGDVVIKTMQPNGVYHVAYVTDDCDELYQIDEVAKRKNAEFIVRACNSHYALVEALKKAHDHIYKVSGGGETAIRETINEALKLAGAA